MNQTDQKDELIIVVDKDDNVKDYMPRNLVHKQKLLHRTIAVTVYNDKGEILLQKRSMKMDNNPGLWSNASGGHVTKGTDYDQTAQQEILEELGINPHLTLIKTMFINDPAHNSMTAIYKAYSNGPFSFNKEEIDEVKFFSKQDLKENSTNLTESAKIVLHEQGVI